MANAGRGPKLGIEARFGHEKKVKITQAQCNTENKRARSRKSSTGTAHRERDAQGTGLTVLQHLLQPALELRCGF